MKSARFWILMFVSVVMAAVLAGPALAGKIIAGGNESIVPVSPDGGIAVVRDLGASSSAKKCYEVTCGTAGDGGLMGATTMSYTTANDASIVNDASVFVVTGDAGTGSNLVAQRPYISTVRTTSAVRVSQGTSCGSFTTGTGRILNEGSTLSWVAQPGPNGEVPLYSCCAEVAGAVWNLCEQ